MDTYAVIYGRHWSTSSLARVYDADTAEDAVYKLLAEYGYESLDETTSYFGDMLVVEVSPPDDYNSLPRELKKVVLTTATPAIKVQVR